MRILQKISFLVIGFYYLLLISTIILPKFASIDTAWTVGFMISVARLYFSPIAAVALLLVIISSYFLYKKEGIKPSIGRIVIFIVLAILPTIQTMQVITLVNQSAQISQQLSAIYTDMIPDTTRGQLHTPSNETQRLLAKDFELYFTEAKKDGTYYVEIYKQKGENVDKYGQAVRSYLKDPRNVGMIFYPNTYIQFYGSTVGNEDQEQGSKSCVSMGWITDIDIGADPMSKIYDEFLGDTELVVYQYNSSQYFKMHLRKGNSCSIIDFAKMPANYTLDTIIEIAKSLTK